jgi:hypothetical protein
MIQLEWMGSCFFQMSKVLGRPPPTELRFELRVLHLLGRGSTTGYCFLIKVYTVLFFIHSAYLIDYNVE